MGSRRGKPGADAQGEAKQSAQAAAEQEQQGSTPAVEEENTGNETTEGGATEEKRAEATKKAEVYDSSRTVEEGMERYVSQIDGQAVLYGEDGNQYVFGADKGTPLTEAEAKALTAENYNGRQVIVKQKGGNA